MYAVQLQGGGFATVYTIDVVYPEDAVDLAVERGSDRRGLSTPLLAKTFEQPYAST